MDIRGIFMEIRVFELKIVFFRFFFLLFSQNVVFLQPQNKEATLAQLVEQRIRNA